MKFYHSVFPILVLSVVSSCAASNVPVFLWGDVAMTSLKSYPLTKVTVEEFGDVMKLELQDDPFTVIFIEETLSVEDFSSRNADGENSFPYLHAKLADSVYLPSVNNALRVLNQLADPEKVDHVKLTENGLSAEIEPESGKFLFINLKDAREGESRSDLLRRHNDFMKETFTKLQGKHNKLVAVYTAHYPSWTIPEVHSRVRRQADNSPLNLTLDGLLVYVNAINLTIPDTNVLNLRDVTANSTTFNGTEQSTSLTFGEYNVTLNFVSSRGYWSFKSVTYNRNEVTEELSPSLDTEVYALTGFSYHCGQVINFTTVNETKQYAITFDNLKIQPFFVSNNESDLYFGESFDCVGFFSVPIWAGLFVVFILLSITFYGIMMMMDIRTMDRFDDPKGKTITINAAE